MAEFEALDYSEEEDNASVQVWILEFWVLSPVGKEQYQIASWILRMVGYKKVPVSRDF